MKPLGMAMVILLALALATPPAIFAQGGGGNPPAKPGEKKDDPAKPAGEKPADPAPANPAAPPANPAAQEKKEEPPKPVDLETLWNELSNAFLKGNAQQKVDAVNRLCALPPQEGLAMYLAKAYNGSLNYPGLLEQLARKFLALESDTTAPEWVKRLFDAEAKKEKNASGKLISILLAFMIKLNLPEALKMTEGVLPKIGEPAWIFSALYDSNKKEFMEIVGKYATGAYKDTPPVLKRLAIEEYLGKWWNGPPCYHARIPFLIQAMEKSDTAEDAKSAIENICLPKFQSAARWKKWWDEIQKHDDLNIIWECFRDAYERVPAPKKAEGAREINEFIAEWKEPRFAWSLDILHKALLSIENGELRNTILYNLGKIGSGTSMDVMYQLLEQPKAQSPELQSDIAKCMGEVAPKNDEKAGSTLTKLYDNTMTESVQKSIIGAWGKMAYKVAVPKLIGVLKDKVGGSRSWESAKALGEMKATEALPDLIEVYRTTADLDLKIHILNSILNMRAISKEVYEIAIDGLDNEDERVRDPSLSILKAMKNPASIPNIKTAWRNDKSSLVLRKKVVETLCVFQPADVYDVLLDALKYRSIEEIDKEKRGEIKFRDIKALNPINKVVVEYFEKDGRANLIKDLLDPLIDVVKYSSNNGRLKALEWIGNPKVWDKRAASAMLGFMVPKEHEDVILAARDILIRNPYKDMVELVIKRLSGGIQGYSELDYQIAYILREYVLKSSEADENNPLNSPDFGTDKKAWTDWWNKVKSKFSFPDGKGEVGSGK